MTFFPHRDQVYGRPDAFLDRCDVIVAAVVETLREEVAKTGGTPQEDVAYINEIMPVLFARYLAVLPPRDRHVALLRAQHAAAAVT